MAVLQDISELEAISSELKHSRLMSEELNAIIESSLTVSTSRTAGPHAKVNTAYERITGIKREEVLGRTMGELVENGFYNESVTLRVLQTRRPESLLQRVKTAKPSWLRAPLFSTRMGT